METSQNPPSPKITSETRDLLMRYFTNKPPEKPLSEQEFNQIRTFIDRRRGGLTREAYEVTKGDKQLIKTALMSQIHKDHRTMDANAPEVRDLLLKVLQTKPGEKVLSIEEYKDIVTFLDRKKGGLRHHAYEIFRNDQEIINAAKDHREAWRSQSTQKERDPEPKQQTQRSNKAEAIRNFIDQHAPGIEQEVKEAEPEPGD